MGNMIDNYINTHTPSVVTQQNNPSMKGDSVPVQKTNTKFDSTTFLEMYSNLKLNKELSGEGLCIDEGRINNQDAYIKTVYSYKDKKIYREGLIGGKKIELVSSHKLEPDSYHINYKGKYNNKDIDLTLSYPREAKSKEFYNKIIRNRLYIPDDLAISGTIDNQPYSIKIPDSPVPRDSDTKDIVTLLLDCNSFSPAVFNGNIVAVEPGKSIVRNWEHKINKRHEFFNENVKPLISQTLSMAVGTFVGIALGKIGLKK